ncbi:MAG TPA: crossover junction endodeoxyribonuclease RuvC [Caldithrix abyssi]|uniref:Crossover junction endodeoxyribonuclease RuvC n=1 Tax=Caldithrix abyssi TaxID=187145 RepID=A0A7V4TZD8_CALAY|nr:crossover junction endodeoxyribonuclease RuvC [Caldithrix abyssi]
MKILGIDPGLNITGYGIIEIAGDAHPRLITFGHIRTSSKKALSERLFRIYRELDTLIRAETPDISAIENVFYADNVKTAILMGHVRGAAIVAAMNNAVPVHEYTPREVKQAVVGNGAAAKSQVKFMVRNLLRIKEDIQPDDASDALAVAFCHWHRMKFDKLVSG